MYRVRNDWSLDYDLDPEGDDQKQAALRYIMEAWHMAIHDGIEPEMLANASFFAALSDLVATYGDGTSERFRLIPGMIADGMVVSPTITTTDQYIALATGAPIEAPRPTAIRVETASGVIMMSDSTRAETSTGM